MRIRKLYFRISVVARFLHEAPSCIRYWGEYFEIQVKQGKGRYNTFEALFTRANVATLKAIQQLRQEGYGLYDIKERRAYRLRITSGNSTGWDLKMLQMGLSDG